MSDFLDIPLRAIDGETRFLREHAGKVMLVVNVASRCGFTPQYAGLEALYRRYGPQGFVALGFPCDQFGHQEPGGDADIKAFCTVNYGVTFPMFAKLEVNGDKAHPLFRALKRGAPGMLGTEAIKWNFTKFLIGRDGRVLRRYSPTEQPSHLASDIEKALAAR
jgi:glutathione peroxidase